MIDESPDVPAETRWLDCAFALLGTALELKASRPSKTGARVLQFAIDENFQSTSSAELRALINDPVDYNTPQQTLFLALLTNVLFIPATADHEITPDLLQNPRSLYLHRLPVATMALLKYQEESLEGDSALKAYVKER